MAEYNRKDNFYKRAKAEGYLSRAAYKLIEIDDKYKFLKKGISVLDCGAAPGGWSQVVLERIGNGKIVGVDIDPITMIRNSNFSFVQGDLRLEEVVNKVLSISDNYDIVISDISPNTTGIKDADHYNSYELVKIVLEVVKRVLARGGIFIFKLFEGEKRQSLINELKTDFKNINIIKPIATRKGSVEIYVIAKGFNQK